MNSFATHLLLYILHIVRVPIFQDTGTGDALTENDLHYIMAPSGIERWQVRMWSKCLSELLNLVAAILSVIGTGLSTFVLAVAPEPTGVTKALAVASGIATLGALAWLISALIAFLDCLERTGGGGRDMDELRAELRRLQERVEKLEKK